MNQRILELLKQASKLANTDDNKDIDRNFDMIVAEKFAQSIVGECIKILADSSEFRACAIVVKHFGVEK